MMEHKVFKMDIKDLDEKTGKFSGYMMVFGVVDSYNDITHPGAFKKTLRETKGQVSVFKLHQPTLMIGMGDTGKEDDKGVFVEATLDVNVNQTAREEFSLMNMAAERKVPFGISMGYDPIVFDYEDRKNTRIRNLREVKLYEYSTCPPNFQAVPGAVVGDLKYLSGPDFDPAKAREWLKNHAHILKSLIENKDLILDIEDIDQLDALQSAGVTTDNGAADTLIEPDDYHSIKKAVEDLNVLILTGGN